MSSRAEACVASSKQGSFVAPSFLPMLQRERCLGHPLDEVGSSAHVRFGGFRLLAPLAQTDTEETETAVGTTVQQSRSCCDGVPCLEAR